MSLETEIARSRAQRAHQRSALKFHPIAEIFPLMEGEEFDALVEDINKHGLRQPITLYKGKILDGRNRYRLAAGKTPKFKTFKNETDPAAYVISVNIHRRHLTTKQKHELIAKLLKANPEKSDRQIAKTVKVSPSTVGTVRTKMEAKGDVSKLDTRKDTKGRRQARHAGSLRRISRRLSRRSHGQASASHHRCATRSDHLAADLRGGHAGRVLVISAAIPARSAQCRRSTSPRATRHGV
jgi:DNA-binding MarR family transcriptional regulator